MNVHFLLNELYKHFKDHCFIENDVRQVFYSIQMGE